MRQSVTIGGLGAERFDAAVRGMSSIFQTFKAHLERRGCRIRAWEPSKLDSHFTLTFSNRYLTSKRDSCGDPSLDLGDVIDPFNILQPLLQSEIHTADNVVEYWTRVQGDEDGR